MFIVFYLRSPVVLLLPITRYIVTVLGLEYFLTEAAYLVNIRIIFYFIFYLLSFDREICPKKLLGIDNQLLTLVPNKTTA
jgi:hypothetical protein